jgi:capsular polysaccharide biosynthesis protein
VLNECGWLFGEGLVFLRDHSWFGEHVEQVRLPEAFPEPRRLQGACLTLLSEFAGNSYGHFILDSLSRLSLVFGAGLVLDDFDHVLCSRPTGRNAAHMFRMLGIPEEKVVWAKDGESIASDIVVAPSFPGTRRNYPDWVPTFLRRTFLHTFRKESTGSSRRLYLSRRGHRRNASNEEAVLRIVRDRGFEVCTPGVDDTDPADLSEAAIVVGPHAGALADLAFCQPGTKVLELLPSDHVHPYFYTLSEAAGLSYSYLLCRSLGERGSDAWGPSAVDFVVDEQELTVALDRLLDS